MVQQDHEFHPSGIIYCGFYDVGQEDEIALKKQKEKITNLAEILLEYNVRCINWTEVKEMGSANPVSDNPPVPEDLGVLMYTSGTTGDPKGVLLTHSNIVTTSVCVTYQLPLLKSSDVYVSYLPLAHIFELSVNYAAIYLGASTGYATQRTLTDSLVRNCKGDLSLLRPTIMVGVPTVFNRVRKLVLQSVSSKGISRTLFRTAYWIKSVYFIKCGLKSPFLLRPVVKIADLLVFSKISAILGGRMRLVISGGSALSKETHQFLQITLPGTVVVQGYGLTETTGPCLLMAEDDCYYGCIGFPQPYCEVKLVDLPELGYLISDKPYPRGEIAVRGYNVAAKGYYNRPEETKAAFLPDGWFLSGDVGELLPNGVFMLIDRKKQLIKQMCGEYIALEKLESIYLTSPYVENICVFASSEYDHCVAIVVPNCKEVERWVCAQDNLTWNVENYEQYLKDICLKDVTLESLNKIGKRYQLSKKEAIRAIHLDSRTWTSENGMVTSALKLKRNHIRDVHQQRLAEIWRASEVL